MKVVLVLLAVLLWPPGTLVADQPDEQVTWGEHTRYHQFERFFITNQPDSAGLELAAQEGVSIVINLRGLSESDWDEAGVSRSLGLEYHQVPVNGAAPQLSEDSFEQINEVVSANPDARILLHCGSGNRAAAWLAWYLADVEGLDTEKAIEIANENGLSKKGLEAKVEALLNE